MGEENSWRAITGAMNKTACSQVMQVVVRKNFYSLVLWLLSSVDEDEVEDDENDTHIDASNEVSG